MKYSNIQRKSSLLIYFIFAYFQQISTRTTTKKKENETINLFVFFSLSLMQSIRCLQKKTLFLSDFTIYTTQAQVEEEENKQKIIHRYRVFSFILSFLF
jgi:hypothetical protein